MIQRLSPRRIKLVFLRYLLASARFLDLREMGMAREGAGVSGERVVIGEGPVEVAQEFVELCGEVVGRRLAAVALEGKGGTRVGAGGAPDAEVDAARVHGREHEETLRDFEGTVVRQHDAAGPDADVSGGGTEGRDEHLGRGTGQTGGAVVFGDPVTVVAERVGEHREIDGVTQGDAAGGAFGDRGLVQEAELEHLQRIGAL